MHLSHTQQGCDCDDIFKPEDLIKFYWKLRYQFFEEGDSTMKESLS